MTYGFADDAFPKGRSKMGWPAVDASHLKIFRKSPAPVTSMWPDINVFNEVGIPSLTYGPPRSIPQGPDSSKGKFMFIKDLVNVTEIYALIAMDICGASIDS